ncbi:hypothetical protein [Kitasatospora sp. MAP5-34]|nr:hypothetical protein [Kitasatospora sp. MAP5-34]MDH6579919.1 hypothetical protein [Kitasatospora sp. MAP5-34]
MADVSAGRQTSAPGPDEPGDETPEVVAHNAEGEQLPGSCEIHNYMLD